VAAAAPPAPVAAAPAAPVVEAPVEDVFDPARTAVRAVTILPGS
jgi:hypothetical protein